MYATADCHDVVELPSKAFHGGEVEVDVVADALTFAVIVDVIGAVMMFVGSAQIREFQYGLEVGHAVHVLVAMSQYGVAIEVALIHD